MQILEAQTADIDQILALQTQIYRVDNVADGAITSLKKQLDDETCDLLVAKEKESVIATATIYYINVAARNRHYALLEGLVVDKIQRGKGIGTEFFKACIEHARKKDCYKMIFTSGKDRTDAHVFYEKMGFSKWGLEFRMEL